MMTDAVVLDVDGTEYTVYINQVSSPAVFLYEGMGYSIEYAGSEAIYTGEDKMYACLLYTSRG